MPHLRDRIPERALDATISDRTTEVPLHALRGGATALSRPVRELEGRSILILTAGQLGAALALVALDGIARRLVVVPPGVSPEHLPMVLVEADIDVVLCDDSTRASLPFDDLRVPIVQVAVDRRLVESTQHHGGKYVTEWVLMTSGTTGVPKLVVHTLETLTSAIPPQPQPDVVWATFYDMRRYGGLQIFLRAVCGGGSFVMSDAGEAPADFSARLATRGATHVSGTPSHWRRALMSAAAREFAPHYVRMSGEIADQTIINSLRARFPAAGVGHAFATTEAGVGFAVDDGLAGFPASYVGKIGSVEVQVVDGSLRLRSAGLAHGYLGTSHSAIREADGFVDTGDLVERHGDRYKFLGRRSGMINVGGLKVYPEEIESVINRHPAVRMSLARAKRSPITGAIVTADIVLNVSDPSALLLKIKSEILALCRESLPVHKVPATIRFVAELNVAAAGKLARADA